MMLLEMNLVKGYTYFFVIVVKKCKTLSFMLLDYLMASFLLKKSSTTWLAEKQITEILIMILYKDKIHNQQKGYHLFHHKYVFRSEN